MNDPTRIVAIRDTGPCSFVVLVETNEHRAKRKASTLRLQGYRVALD